MVTLIRLFSNLLHNLSLANLLLVGAAERLPHTRQTHTFLNLFIRSCLVNSHPRPSHTPQPCTAAGPATAPRRGTAGYTSYRRTEPTLPY